MTEFTGDGLRVNPQDLAAISPDGEDDDRMFHHDGSSAISVVGGGSDSTRGYYIWSAGDAAWFPLFQNADKIDGKEAGDFLWRDGSLPMEADLDAGNFGIINVGEVNGGTGGVHLNSNNIEVHSHEAGSSIQLKDNNGLLLLDASEGGDVNAPNGTLSEQGQRVATRSWTNLNADVPNADYADNSGALGGKGEAAYLHVSGDQMEGVLSLGSNNIEDGADTLWDAVNAEVPQASLGGPADSLSAYPLAAGDLAEDYVLTSRLPLIASDLAEDYVLTSRLPLPAGDLAEDYAVTSRFPIPNSDVANSSVTVAGNSVSLGGSVTPSVSDFSAANANVDLGSSKMVRNAGGSSAVMTFDSNNDGWLAFDFTSSGGGGHAGFRYEYTPGQRLVGFKNKSNGNFPFTVKPSGDLLAGNETATLWDNTNSEVPQGILGGPASSLSGYPLANSDLSNSSVTVTAGTGIASAGTASLGGSLKVDVDDSRYVNTSGDSMAGVLDVAANDLVDGTTTVWDTLAGEVPQAVLGGPAASLNGYPLQNSDLNNSTVTVNAGNQLTGGGSVGLGGSITVDVDEGAGSGLDADTVDGDQASDLVHVAGDTMSGVLTLTNSDTKNLQVNPSSGDPTVSFGHPSAGTLNLSYATNLHADATHWLKFAESGNNGGNDGVAMSCDNSDVIPLQDAMGDLGKSSARFRNLHLSGAGYIGGDRVATRAWTDANADVPNADYADNAGDSDTLDGEHASAFANAGHLHDGRYIMEGGDTMAGVLTLQDGSTAASRSWVNGNADVPNADYADSAGDANALDSLDSSQFLRSDVADTLNAELTVSGETKVNFGGTNYHVRYDSTRDTLVLGSAENGEVMEVDNAGNLRIEGSLTEGATIGS